MLGRLGGGRFEVRPGIAALIVLAAALAARGPVLGNPLIYQDEQFYLLVGARMWNGALPFVSTVIRSLRRRSIRT